jgi:hypothetical protein
MFLRIITVVALLVLPMATAAAAHDDDGRGDDGCSLATLDGLYVFSASGFVTPPGVTPFPKAIVELIRFHGDGTVTTPTVTVAVTGRPLTSLSPGATGTYTVDALVPPDRACVGTLAFNDATGNTFNMIIPSGAGKISLIQTNVTSGDSPTVTNVFEGTAVKIAH